MILPNNNKTVQRTDKKGSLLFYCVSLFVFLYKNTCNYFSFLVQYYSEIEKNCKNIDYKKDVSYRYGKKEKQEKTKEKIKRKDKG